MRVSYIKREVGKACGKGKIIAITKRFSTIWTWLARDQIFDHVIKQVHTPVNYLTCCFFLKWKTLSQLFSMDFCTLSNKCDVVVILVDLLLPFYASLQWFVTSGCNFKNFLYFLTDVNQKKMKNSAFAILYPRNLMQNDIFAESSTFVIA